MQEPVSSENDVEDVLSSIRRLVAQGGRKGRASHDETRQAPTPAGKFVLTPDFRISEPAGGNAQSPAAPGSESPASPPLAESDDAAAGDSLPDRTHSSIAELERTILELEAAIGAQNIEFEPDGSEDPAQEAATAVPLPRLRRQEEDEKAPAMTAPEDRVPGFASSRAARQDEAAHEARHVTEHETAPAPDAEASGVPALDAPATGDAGTPEPAALPLDEDALRDIIREVLQEELRGELGLRITRNVRKLVRREIRRTLESLGIE